MLGPGGTGSVTDPTILYPPDELDIELTDHEREVFEAYGVQTPSDPDAITMDDAIRLAAASPFRDMSVREGEQGDIGLRFTRKE